MLNTSKQNLASKNQYTKVVTRTLYVATHTNKRNFTLRKMIGWDDLGAPQLEPLDWKPSVLTIKPLFHFLSLARTGILNDGIFNDGNSRNVIKTVKNGWNLSKLSKISDRLVCILLILCQAAWHLNNLPTYSNFKLTSYSTF